MGRPCLQALRRRRTTPDRLAGASRPVPRREDQPRARARRRQGIGKDTLLEPVKQAVGPWNFAEVSPVQLLGRFNGFLKSVDPARLRGARPRRGQPLRLLRPHEGLHRLAARRAARSTRRTSANIRCSTSAASSSPPTTRRTASICPPTIAAITSRGPTLTLDDFEDGYWTGLYHWYEHGGYEIVAHHLAEHDLTGFDPKAPPPKTEAFWEIVDAVHAPENAELLTVLEECSASLTPLP